MTVKAQERCDSTFPDTACDWRIATFRLQYEDDYEDDYEYDYEYEFPYWARALSLNGENYRSARAQNLKLVLVVVVVLQSEGR